MMNLAWAFLLASIVAAFGCLMLSMFHPREAVRTHSSWVGIAAVVAAVMLLGVSG